MMPRTEERRRQPRQSGENVRPVQVGIPSHSGQLQVIKAKLTDISALGAGVETAQPLGVGTLITLWGPLSADAAAGDVQKFATVVHCHLAPGSTYRTGCSFEKANDAGPAQFTVDDTTFIDYYEVLQLSPNADQDTIQRVYRIMAQRLHPDNTETGDAQAFQRLLRAYQVLNDAERRAAYDVEYASRRALRWKIFDQKRAAHGIEAEQRKRWGILSVLYSQRMEQPDRPGLRIRDFEELLGCPREHLEFAVWYLRDAGLIAMVDQGRFAITVKGVNTAEESELWEKRRVPLLLQEGGPASDESPSRPDDEPTGGATPGSLC